MPSRKALAKVQDAFESDISDMAFGDLLKNNHDWLVEHYPSELRGFEDMGGGYRKARK